jgi:hypothetical protein
MTHQAANISSIDAVRSLKLALQQFQSEATSALVMLELEARRALEWIDSDRSRYWPREVRKASDAVAEARIALERCEVTTGTDEGRYCYDERKALEKAKRRLYLAEAKVQAVKRWQLKIHKEVDEFHVQIAKLQQYLESDFLRAIAALDRMAQALDRYVQRRGPDGLGESPSAARPVEPVAKDDAGRDAGKETSE